jgi:hypothetical protein
MTPEYFETGPSKKQRAVRRAAPTVQKYVEQIDEANIWLSRYMERRPTLMGRLKALEQKRLQVSREVLCTYAKNMKVIGDTLTSGATDIEASVAEINDTRSTNEFVLDCRKKPTPHLEDPPLFTYSLPVPIEELGLRPPKDLSVARASAVSSTPHRKATLRAVEQHNRDLERSAAAAAAAAATGSVDDDEKSESDDTAASQAPNRNTGNKLGSFAAALFHSVRGNPNGNLPSPRRVDQAGNEVVIHDNESVPRRSEIIDEQGEALRALHSLPNTGASAIKPKPLNVDIEHDEELEVAPTA